MYGGAVKQNSSVHKSVLKVTFAAETGMDKENRKTGEVSQPPKSSSTTSDDATVQEVRQAIRTEFAKGLQSLGDQS